MLGQSRKTCLNLNKLELIYRKKIKEKNKIIHC